MLTILHAVRPETQHIMSAVCVDLGNAGMLLRMRHADPGSRPLHCDLA